MKCGANWEQDTYPGGAGRRLTNIMDEHPIYPCRRPMLNTRQKHITKSSTPHRRQTVIMVLSDPSINDRGDSQLRTFSVF